MTGIYAEPRRGRPITSDHDGPLCKCGGSLISQGEREYTGGLRLCFRCSECGDWMTVRRDALSEAERWRYAGYKLVMRCGSVLERQDARKRAKQVRKIHEQTARWLAEQQRRAA